MGGECCKESDGLPAPSSKPIDVTVKEEYAMLPEWIQLLINQISACNPSLPGPVRSPELTADGNQIQRWDLSCTQLTILPDSFCSLVVLGDVDLFGNRLSTLPDQFGTIRVGGYIGLGGNLLSTVPTSFGKLKASCCSSSSASDCLAAGRRQFVLAGKPFRAVTRIVWRDAGRRSSVSGH